jgi:hypothetical protein
MHRATACGSDASQPGVHVMEAVEFVLLAIAGALITIGLGMMVWPTRMARMTGWRRDGRRPTADEILQKRILGVGLAAIGVFALYMVVSHHQCRICLASWGGPSAGPVLFRQSADAARIRLVD